MEAAVSELRNTDKCQLAKCASLARFEHIFQVKYYLIHKNIYENISEQMTKELIYCSVNSLCHASGGFFSIYGQQDLSVYLDVALCGSRNEVFFSWVHSDGFHRRIMTLEKLPLLSLAEVKHASEAFSSS